MTRLWPWLTFWLCLLCLAAPAGAQPLVTVSGEDHWISVGVATVDRRAIGTAALPMDWPRDQRRDHLPAASSADGVRRGYAYPVPSLQPSGAYNQTAERAGGWTERTFTADFSFKPPFTVRFAALTVDGIGISGTRSTPTASGIVEIDWIELVRAPVSLGP